MQVAWNNDGSTHVRAKTADVFRQAVHNDIGPEVKWALAIRSRKGVIDNNVDRFLSFAIGFVRNLAYRNNVDKLQGWVDRSLEINHAGAIGDRSGQVVRMQ